MMVLQNYPFIGCGKPGNYCEIIPMSWIYQGISGTWSNMMREVSGESIADLECTS